MLFRNIRRHVFFCEFPKNKKIKRFSFRQQITVKEVTIYGPPPDKGQRREDQEEILKMTTSLAAAKETGVYAAAVVVSLELDGISTLKEK